MKRPWHTASHSILTALLLATIPVHAVIFYADGDPAYNTTAPGGSLTNSGWQFEGIWGGFLGTPVAPKYFITARHVGGSVGETIAFNGVAYPTTACYDDPDSDLRIWRICGTFPTYAPIYAKTNETNKGFVVIGRGTKRGDPVTTTNVLGTVKTNGWQWGLYDGVVRWGENAVAEIVNGDSLFGGRTGDLLQATFDANGGANECHLSLGDSGGAVFIQDGGTWKLAGINYAVEGPYNTTNGDPGFNAAIFDGTGLYEKSVAGLWLPADGPGSFYATRISAHVPWINSILNSPAPGDNTPVLQFSPTVAPSSSYSDETNAGVDEASKTITVALPGETRFYRLRACGSLVIRSIQVQGADLVLRYE